MTTTTTTMTTDNYAQVAAQIKQLLQETKASRRDDRADAARLDELRRVFRNVAQNGDFDNSQHHHDDDDDNDNNKDNQDSSARLKWRTFLKKSFHKMIHQLMNRITIGGKRTAIRTLWAVIANFPIKTSSSPTSNGNNTVDIINVDLLIKWIHAIITTPNIVWKDQSVQHMIQIEFIQPFRDVQYYVMIAIIQIANQLHDKLIMSNDDNKYGNDQKVQQHQHDYYAQQAERLVQLLMMIPIVTSQKELDDTSTSKYLYPPPPPTKDAFLMTNHGGDDNDDESEEDNDDEDDDSDDSSSSSSDDEDDGDKKKSSSSATSRAILFMSFQRKSDHVRVWNKAWLAVLRLSCLPTSSLQIVLQFLPRHVLSIVSHPIQYADFYMQAYSMTSNINDNDTTDAAVDDKNCSSSSSNDKKEEDKNKRQRQYHHHQASTSSSSSIIPILALDGLFILMTKHGLEYPNYYQQLYRLVTVPLFYYKKSTSQQFFILLEKSLVYNELLPAHVVAAFIKRLARCALYAPPASILLALALISNVLRKHPETSCLIQAASASKSESTSKNEKNNNVTNNNTDAFDAMTDDPVQARALQSSLWELQALTHHYHAAVATLADSIGRVDESKVPSHVLHDFTSLNYKSLFETDRKRAAVIISNSSATTSDDKDIKKSKKRKRNSSAAATTTTALTFARPDNGLFGNPGDVLVGLMDVPFSSSLVRHEL